jgi:hypothetical protein
MLKKIVDLPKPPRSGVLFLASAGLVAIFAAFR